MEKEMNAERNKRALILESEAQRQSAVTIAEGKKQAACLNVGGLITYKFAKRYWQIES